MKTRLGENLNDHGQVFTCQGGQSPCSDGGNLAAGTQVQGWVVAQSCPPAGLFLSHELLPALTPASMDNGPKGPCAPLTDFCYKAS